MTFIWWRFLVYIALALFTSILDEIVKEMLHIEVKSKSRNNSILYRAARDVLSWATLIGVLWVWGFL